MSTFRLRSTAETADTIGPIPDSLLKYFNGCGRDLVGPKSTTFYFYDVPDNLRPAIEQFADNNSLQIVPDDPPPPNQDGWYYKLVCTAMTPEYLEIPQLLKPYNLGWGENTSFNEMSLLFSEANQAEIRSMADKYAMIVITRQ